jgi:hypothetical protein
MLRYNQILLGREEQMKTLKLFSKFFNWCGKIKDIFSLAQEPEILDDHESKTMQGIIKDASNENGGSLCHFPF